MRTVTRVAAAILALVVLWIPTVRPSNPPRLVLAGLGYYEDWLFGASGFNIGADEPWVLQVGAWMCLDTPGSVTITRVRALYSVAGTRVDAFAVIPIDAPNRLVSRDDEVLARWGWEMAPVEVDRACPDLADPLAGAHMVAFAAQLSKPKTRTGRAGGLSIEYVSDGHVRALRIMADLVLCGGDGSLPEWREECGSWDLAQYQQVARI